MIKYESSRAENRKMAKYISIPDTKSGNNLKLNRVVKEIWIQDIGHIRLKYKKINERIRKMAEVIRISDIRPIRIKYDKLIASSRKMVEEIWRKFKLQIWDIYWKNMKKLGARIRKMAEEIGISDTRPILIKYDTLSASLGKMAEETWIPDTRSILLKYEKLIANTTKMAEEIRIQDTRPILINVTN